MFLKQTHRCPLSAKNCQPLRIFKFNYTFKQESCQILFCHTQRYCFAMHTSTVLPYTPVLLCHTQRQRFVIHNGTGVPYAKVLFCLAQQKTVILIDNVYQYTDRSNFEFQVNLQKRRNPLKFSYQQKQKGDTP